MNERRRGRWSRILRWVGIGVVACAVIYALGGIGFNWLTQSRAGVNSQAAYDEWAPELELWSATTQTALAPSWGEPLATREQLTCHVYGAEQGWFVADHIHVCHLTHIAVYDAPEDPTAAHDDLFAVPGAAGLFGSDERFRADAQCPGLAEAPDTSRTARTVVVHLDVKGQSDALCLRNVAPRVQDDRDLAFDDTIAGSLDGALTGEQAVVAITWSKRLSMDRLGCNPFVPLFCEPPLFADVEMPQR